MTWLGALLVVLAGGCKGLRDIYAIPAEERRELRENMGWISFNIITPQGTLIGWFAGIASISGIIAYFAGLENIIGLIAALVWVLSAGLFVGQLLIGFIIGTLGKLIVPTSTLPTPAKTALTVLAVLLGLSGAIIVFLTTGHT
jgi:hypothetical protein